MAEHDDRGKLADAVREYGEPATPEDLIRRGVRRIRCVSTQAVSELIDRAINLSLELRLPGSSPDQLKHMAREAQSGLLGLLRGVEDVEASRGALRERRHELEGELARMQSDRAERVARPLDPELSNKAQTELSGVELDAQRRLRLALRAAFGRALTFSSAPSRAQAHELSRLEQDVLRITQAALEQSARQHREVTLRNLTLAAQTAPATQEWREPFPQPALQPLARPALEPLAPSMPLLAIVAEPLPEPLAPVDDGQRDLQVERLERRIQKLMAALADTERALERVSEMKNLQPGLASFYRAVEGLSDEDRLAAIKRRMLRTIFSTNVELQQADGAGAH